MIRIEAVFAGSVSRASGGPDAICEDAFGVVQEGGKLRAVVADGASDSLHADRWARVLTEAALATFPANDWFQGDRLATLREKWRVTEAQIPSALPWYAVEAKQGRGAYAALLVIEVNAESGASKIIQASAVGDCAAFLLREGAITESFPFRASADFPTLPFLVGSRDERIPDEAMHRWEGAILPGDEWFLMTDALGLWFLAEAERGSEPWRWLRDLGSHKQPITMFAERIAQLRGAGRLRDDDATLIHLRACDDASG